MTIHDLRENTSALRAQKQAYLNDTYMWVDLARRTINALPDAPITFQTPKARKANELRTIVRTDSSTVKARIVDKDIFISAFASMVASVEDYLSKVMRWILKADTKRLKCTIKDVKMMDSVSVVELVDHDKDTIIDNLIQQRINALFYASPQKYLEYFDKALGIKVDVLIWEKWIEIKACRDLWIHNSGIVNQVYLDKTKGGARHDAGQEATIDSEYFREATALMKRMIGSIDHEIRTVFQVPLPDEGL